jgi:rRNA-processing protein FCF1
MKFLLDTNFLMIPGKFKIDVFSGLTAFGKPELMTLDLVVKELKGIRDSNKGKDSLYAKVGLLILKRKKIKIKRSHYKDADNEIVRMAKKDKENIAVCTQDEELVKRLKKEKVLVIGLRQEKYLTRW